MEAPAMRRRTLLSTLGAGSIALAGCRSLPSFTPTPAPEELPEVTVTYRVDYGLSDVRRRILDAEQGRLHYRSSCRDDAADGRDVERSLSRDEYVEVQRLVVRSDPPSWRERYRCRVICAEDALGYHLVVTVEDQAYETSVGGLADPPPRIEALGDRMAELRDRFEDVEDCS